MRRQTQQELKEAEDFNRRQEQILEQIPVEFHSFVRTHAWEYGHSCGYSEVLIIEEDLIFHLTRAINSYKLTLGIK